MDRRLKFILLIIGSVLLLGAVFWFIVWPLLKPVLPEGKAPQPPPLGEPTPPQFDINGGEEAGTPSGAGIGEGEEGALEFAPTDVSPDVQRILDLSRRAGVLSERVESGSSSNRFQNLDDAALDASPSLAATLRQMQSDLRDKYPMAGPVYLTIARRLVEIPENETRIARDTFDVRVQMQVEIQDAGKKSVEYLESTVTFRRQGAKWVTDDYRVETFTP